MTKRNLPDVVSCRRHDPRPALVAATVVATGLTLILGKADAFLHSTLPLTPSVGFEWAPRKISWTTTASTSTSLNKGVSTNRHHRHAATKDATSASVGLESVVVDLRTRIIDTPEDLPENREAQLDAEKFIASSKRFEVDGGGNIVGGAERERQLVEALSRETVVVVRVTDPEAKKWLAKLGDAAEDLLGESRTVEEKEQVFGAMQAYDGGVVAGYAGGESYGNDQFLETRGNGGGRVVPAVDEALLPNVRAGRRILSKITSSVLGAVVRWSLPGINSADFLELVDDGEGEEAGDRHGSEGIVAEGLSSTPLRMCRYAGADGVAFGAHTDTTFLTVIPCASAPGLEILEPSTGRWIRPEAAGDAIPGADVMLLAGELLQVLGQGRYQAAVHRVVRPVGLLEPRVSTPLLVRGNANVAVTETILPGLAREGVDPDGARVVSIGRERGTATAGEALQRVTMRDLWIALQFKAEPSDETPLAQSHVGREDELRRNFSPFAPKGLSVLSVDPLLVRLNAFASPAVCEEIIARGSGSMLESKTWGGVDSQDESVGLRKSSTTWVADESSPLLEVLTAKVCALSGLPSTFMEKWQVARYEARGFFNLHTDHVESFNNLCCGGRLSTLIVYLNDDFSGGHTEFPTLGVSVKPSVGDAIYFHSVVMPVERVDADHMTVDERSAHAGLPVDEGEKWIATKWIHPLPYPNGRQGPQTRQQAEWDKGNSLRKAGSS